MRTAAASLADPTPVSWPPLALASRLACAGLAPLVAGALVVWLVRADFQPFAALALSAYAAQVASFAGAIYRGLGDARRRPAGGGLRLGCAAGAGRLAGAADAAGPGW